MRECAIIALEMMLALASKLANADTTDVVYLDGFWHNLDTIEQYCHFVVI